MSARRLLIVDPERVDVRRIVEWVRGQADRRQAAGRPTPSPGTAPTSPPESKPESESPPPEQGKEERAASPSRRPPDGAPSQ